MRGLLLAALLLAGAGQGVAGADDLGQLLEGLGPTKAPEGGVTVTSWVEGPAKAADLVVRVEPHGAAKLVSEPAITVTAEPQAGLAWAATLVSSDPPAPAVAYFKTPVELRLPFRASGPSPVNATVEYAYCLVGYQCLFGEARVTATIPSG
jgi:hypothetical protein